MLRDSIKDDIFAGFDFVPLSKWDTDAGQSHPISNGGEYALTRLRHVLTLATLIVFRPRCYLGLVLTNHLMDIVGCWLVCFVCRFGDLPQQTVAAQVET